MPKGDISKIEKAYEKEIRFKITSSYGFNNSFDLLEEKQNAVSANGNIQVQRQRIQAQLFQE